MKITFGEYCGILCGNLEIVYSHGVCILYKKKNGQPTRLFHFENKNQICRCAQCVKEDE